MNVHSALVSANRQPTDISPHRDTTRFGPALTHHSSQPRTIYGVPWSTGAFDARSLISDRRLLQDPRLRYRVDPADYDNDAPRWASQHGHLLVVNRLLVDPRVDPVDDSNWAVRTACKLQEVLEAGQRDVHVVDRLLQDPRVDPAAEDSYAIRRAAARRHWSVVARLLACRPGLPAVPALTSEGPTVG